MRPRPLLREITPYNSKVQQKPHIDLRKMHLHHFSMCRQVKICPPSRSSIYSMYCRSLYLKKKNFQSIIRDEPHNEKVKGGGQIVHMVLANNDIVSEITRITSISSRGSVIAISQEAYMTLHSF